MEEAMYRKILVPLDGTGFAEHALPLARSIARRSGAELHLVAVVPPERGLLFATAERNVEAGGRQEAYLASIRERLGTDVPVSTAILEGDIVPCLCAYAASRDVELMVIATHGRGALARFWLGSVADEVIRHAHLPILLVHPEEGEVDLAREPDPHKVVVCLDGTEKAERIIEPTIKVGALLPDAEFLLVRVIPSVLPFPHALDGPALDEEVQQFLHQIQMAQERLHHEAECYLRGVADRLRARGLRAELRVVIDERPEEGILHEAFAAGAGLIALETHGRGGLARLVLGSVTDKVLRSAPVPVLVQA
jgi:nucleotide-binding universal stress UspA family protein